jgi:2OG-Fe(II) oxygenase superfamily
MSWTQEPRILYMRMSFGWNSRSYTTPFVIGKMNRLCWEEEGTQNANVSAELYKLLLYDDGGFFVSHRDTEKTEGMFGTLVIVLPSLHSGGEVIVRHAGREVVLDLATTDVSQLNYAAFYADCEHEVRPVAHGNRLCLIYNLIQRPGDPNRQKPLNAPDYDKEIASAAILLGDWVKRLDAPPKVVYLLEHQYSPAGLSFLGLKNADAARGKVLSNGGKRGEMLEVLRSTGDGKLIQRFIEKVTVSQYDGSENKQLAICRSLLEPSKAGELFSALVEENMPFFHGACVDLLSRLVAVESCDPILLAANRKTAGSVVKMLSKINPSEETSTQAGWWQARYARPPVEASSIASLFDILRRLEAVELRDTAAAALIAYPETYAPDTVLVPALSEMRQQQRGETADAAFFSLWKGAAEFLLLRSEFPPREPADWAQPVKLDCRCAECRQLQSFAEDPAQKVYRFRVRKDRRQHLHRTIESYQMDMTHQTERKGSPQNLVCTKTRRSYLKRCQQHAEDLGHFKTLIAIVANLPKELQSLFDRMRQAIRRGPLTERCGRDRI